MLAQGDRPFGNRLDDLTRAFQEARANTIDSRRYNRTYLLGRANTDPLEPGHHVVLKVGNRSAMTSRWDPHWMVTRCNGPAVYINHQLTGVNKVVNRDKLLRVDPDVVWDEVNPRPPRAPRQRPLLFPLPGPDDALHEGGPADGEDPDWLPGGRRRARAAPPPAIAPDPPVVVDAREMLDQGVQAGGAGNGVPGTAADADQRPDPTPPVATRPTSPPLPTPDYNLRPRDRLRATARARENFRLDQEGDAELRGIFIRSRPESRSPSPAERKRQKLDCIALVQELCW